MKDFSLRVLALVCSVVFLASSSTMASNVSPDSSEIGRTWSVEYAARKGKARGRGDTKAEAYADAAGRVPSGATTGRAQYFKTGQRYSCWLFWTKG